MAWPTISKKIFFVSIHFRSHQPTTKTAQRFISIQFTTTQPLNAKLSLVFFFFFCPLESSGEMPEFSIHGNSLRVYFSLCWLPSSKATSMFSGMRYDQQPQPHFLVPVSCLCPFSFTNTEHLTLGHFKEKKFIPLILEDGRFKSTVPESSWHLGRAFLVGWGMAKGFIWQKRVSLLACISLPLF
jgi:hypothetical protein